MAGIVVNTTCKTYAQAAVGKFNSASVLQTRCLHCPRPGIISLNCSKHKLCQKCLPKNIAIYGSDEDAMYTCPAPECALPTASPPIWIFVDNSNIWIEAKKLASKVKRFKSSEDHRIRISIGNLTDVVAKRRDVTQGTLYGSEPPRIDSVWDKIREHEHWNVKTKKKSFITHKEKEVDAQLLVDVTEVACTTPPQERSTIVLITGDADMCPAVEKVMKYKGWKAEIYMWEDGLSDRLKAISRDNADVICEPLDNHLMDIVFTNIKFPISGSQIPVDCSAVLTMINPKVRVIDPNSGWWQRLESTAQWPVQYWWIVQDGDITDHLLLVFRHKGQKEKYNVSYFVKTLNDHAAEYPDKPLLPRVQIAETYIDFKRRLTTYRTAVMKYGAFKLNDLADEKTKHPIFSQDVFVVDRNPTSPNVSSTDDTFKSVPPSQVGGPPSQEGGQEKTCCYGRNCIRGLVCHYNHSDKDRSFFKKNGGKGMPYRKTQMCNKYPYCSYKDECNFAHGDSDRWCLYCRQYGHFIDACPNCTR